MTTQDGSIRAALDTRLAQLSQQRRQIAAEIVHPVNGDEADRATNVDAHVQLAAVDQHIRIVENELSGNEETASDSDSGIGVGASVTIDLGDGPETYVFGPIDYTSEPGDVITPSSPLGLALRHARVGSRVEYASNTGETLTARLLDVG